MTPEKCPNCGTRLEPSMSACPNCPMSFPEDDSSSYVHPLKQTRYYQFLMPVLFFGGLGFGIWTIANGLYNLAEQSSNAVDGVSMVQYATTGGPAVKKTSSSAQPATSSTPRAKAEAQVDSEPMVVLETPRRKPVRKWRLHGTVYDLADLRPLIGCTMIFSDPAADHRIMTQTDAAGQYRVEAPPLADRGYLVEIRKGGYSPSYLNPGPQGARSLSEQRRQELVQSLGAALSPTPATVEAEDEKPLITDFYLARQPWAQR